ncbi:MAG: hypothetical protein H6708_17910 [Kofleriaceae bacterium]|nr:hypothetical protein [Kofleriaceae bacterium]
MSAGIKVQSPRLAGTVGSRRAMLETLVRHLPMVRLRVPALLALVLAAGCAGQITTPGGSDDAAVAAAKAKFTASVQPIMDGFCGSCHLGQANIDFLRPEPDPRTQMLAWDGLVRLDAPPTSGLLTKGAHSGPALTPDQSAVILDWIDLEVLAAGGEPPADVETEKLTPQPGVNTLDLGPIGLTGSSLSFLYEPLATGMYLSDIQVTGGTGGVHVVNPLFVIWNEGSPEPDPINRFGNIDLVVQEGLTSYVGGGTAVFVDVAPTSDISVHFRVAELADGTDPGGGDGGVVGGGCNNVPAFTSAAQPPLAASCGNCHGAGGQTNAISATDMTRIADLTAEGQAAACAQVKTRVNALDPVNSGLFLAPDPNSGTQHPFKFATATDFQNFRNAVVQWINQE